MQLDDFPLHQFQELTNEQAVTVMH